jgi:hypothetical protein
MKRFFFLAGVLALLATASCKDDDTGDNTPAPGQITFDGKTYTVRKGFVIDFRDDGSHYNQDFLLFDTNISLADLEEDELNATFGFYAELFSPGIDQFRTGTFTFTNADVEELEGDYYFQYADLVVDSNNDSRLSMDEDDVYIAQSGTITVSGTPSNYTMTLDLMMNGSKRLQGSYSGSFQYVDGIGQRAPWEDLRIKTRK